MANFTPGPWKAVEVNEEIPLPAGVLIAVHKAGDYSKQGCICDIRAQGDGKYEPEVTNANAHLISASPEMYEALKVILPMAKGYADVNNVGNNKEMIGWAEAILAKAEGRRERWTEILTASILG